jgi:hypothetical protein
MAGVARTSASLGGLGRCVLITLPNYDGLARGYQSEPPGHSLLTVKVLVLEQRCLVQSHAAVEVIR